MAENSRVTSYRNRLEVMEANTQGVSLVKFRDHLRFLEVDLLERNVNPLFIAAQACFNRGFRLSWWGIDAAVDPSLGSILWKDGVEVLRWQAAKAKVTRDNSAFYETLGLNVTYSEDEKHRVLWHLANLTQEEDVTNTPAAILNRMFFT